MSLIDLFHKQGDYCFKYRGQLPILLFLLVIPFIFFADYSWLSKELINNYTLLAIFFCLLGLLIRFYTIATTSKGTSGRNRSHQIADTLNTKGIYSIVRNPLYLGNFLIWFGVSISTFNIYFIIIMSVIFVLFYERVILMEEKFLINKFGDEYLSWSFNTPVIIPSFSRFVKSDVPFSFLSILRREYATVASTTLSFIYIEILRNYIIYDNIFLRPNSFVISIVILTLVIILSLLKHYTSLLNEKDRS